MAYARGIGYIFLKRGNSKFKEGDVPELFNLKQDVGESDNLLQKYPDKVKELQLLMQKY